MFRYMKKKFVTEGSNRTKSQLTAAPCPGFPVDSRETNVPTGQKLVEGCFADELKGLREFLLSVYCGVRWSAKPSNKKFMFEKLRLVIAFPNPCVLCTPLPLQFITKILFYWDCSISVHFLIFYTFSTHSHWCFAYLQLLTPETYLKEK